MNSSNTATLFPQLVISRTRGPFANTASRDSLKTDRPVASHTIERRDLSSLMRLVTWIFEPLATRKQVKIQVDAPVAGLIAVCDELRLQRVLEILLTNAINSSPAGSTIVLAARQEGSRLRFSVEDEGTGVSADDQDSFFDGNDNALIHFISPECDEDNDLAICRRIVAAHGGMISMRNRAKGGTRYEFSIPTVSPRLAFAEAHVA
jgi:signal transduction histidine kinase